MHACLNIAGWALHVLVSISLGSREYRSEPWTAARYYIDSTPESTWLSLPARVTEALPMLEYAYFSSSELKSACQISNFKKFK